jgi:tonB-linked outer membrane protein, susC/ragA family
MRKFLLLIALFCPLWLLAQNEGDYRTIKGVVMDSVTNETLIGATVVIDPDAPESKNLGPKGTITDIDGNFELKVPKAVNYVVISFIGYKPLKLDISKKTEFKVLLQPDQEQLEEVVVTGYQKIEKRKATSAIQTVKMDDIKRIGVASIDQLLEGQVAGMTSIPTNGAPGAPNKMRIRSTVSLSGSTDPLWVMDGMILEGNDIPTDFSSKDNIDELYNTSIGGVNPSDIQDITILKDAAATAIYGARAANGVIVITTKKGSMGKPRVNFSGGVFYTLKPDLDKLNLMNASEKVDFELDLASRSDLDYRSDYGEVARILKKHDQLGVLRENGFGGLSSDAQTEINALRNINTDWGDVIYRNAVNQQYNLSVSGGSDLARYYFSGGYYNEEGTTRNTGFERYNITMKTDFDIIPNLNVGVSLFVTDSKRNSYLTDADAFINPANYSRNANPYLKLRDENGDYVYDQDIEGYSGRYVKFNYLEEMNNTKYTLKNRSIKPMLSLNYKVASWLNLSTQFGMQLEHTSSEKIADKETYYVRKYRERTRVSDGTYFLPDGGIIQNATTDMNQYQWKLQGEFNKYFAEKHEVNVMAGLEMRGNKTTTIQTKGFGYDPNSLTTKPLVFPTGSTAVDEAAFRQYQKSFAEDRFLSYYMTASYAYDNRYVFFGSLRYDGSNMFGVDRKYKYLPLWSVSGAWNINREEFMRDVEWLSNLKLRASYGIQGNVDKNTSPELVGSWGNVTILPGESEPNISVDSPPNQYLRWEKTRNWNGGLDVAVLDNRIALSLDVYHRLSKDLIGLRSLPGENGFNFSNMNWARLTNKGFELSLSTVNIQIKDFKWSMDFNIAHNKSVINKINVRENSYEPSREGHSVGAVFSLKTAGLDENGMQMFYNKQGQKVTFNEFYQLREGSQMGGMITFLESGLSAEQYRDLYTYEGTTEPKFTGGWINKFRYRNFDLTIAASFILDQTVQETPFYNPATTSPGQNYSNRMSQIWSPSNPTGKYARLIGTNTEGEKNWGYQWLQVKDPGNSYRSYDIWFKQMSYMRINSIRLGYNIPEEIMRKIGFAAARISFESRNPFVFGGSYKGYFDPETYGSIYAQPLAKTFSCGIDLTF